MGCFDTVIVKCPECKHEIEFQSKTGGCNMYEYSHNSVPIDVVPGIVGYPERCENCYREVILQTNIKNISLFIED